MKRLFLFSILLISSLSSTLGQDFRNAEWGMSRRQVRNLEGNDYQETSQAKEYLTWEYKNRTLGNSLVAVYYQFYKNKVVRGWYIRSDRPNVQASFNAWRVEIEEKYGSPTTIDTEFAGWALPRTMLMLFATHYTKYDIYQRQTTRLQSGYITIAYYSVEHEKAIQDEKKGML